MKPRLSERFRVEEVPGKSRGGRQCVKLLEPIEYEDEDGIVIVPPGFVSDWASVPFWADGLIPSFGPHARAALVHDFLYSVGGKQPHKDYTRAEADRIFRTCLKLCGVPAWRRELMFRAVRTGGASGWNKPD